ncbi:MAG: hypothetical protein ABIP48_15315 [Planctomycetota bacterium]
MRMLVRVSWIVALIARMSDLCIAAEAPPRPEASPVPEVEEVIFAVRSFGPDGHYYANFGYYSHDPAEKAYAEGGQLCRLKLATGEVAVLLDDATGGVRDPQLHYDAGKILFSYRPGGTEYYHLYEINVDGTCNRSSTNTASSATA